jgi:hypothetical protein
MATVQVRYIVNDPSGNPLELFQPILSEARLDSKDR